jgi:hypothetical protein
MCERAFLALCIDCGYMKRVSGYCRSPLHALRQPT